ncbi:choice-of-anchor N protein [Nitrospira sp. NS4]|uniref:choice-of-anchor N protein n=1 Tax=Nitrospira sp. NS4 TaxID=3414498 RepID=UPI003C2FC2B9
MNNQCRNGLSGFLSGLTLFGLLAVGAPAAHAVPSLQLDIAGGWYDTATQTVMTQRDTFTVYALIDTTARPGSAPSLTDTYYLSVALEPLTSAAADLGSFSVNGTLVNVTSGMTFGTPPIEGLTATFDQGDLAPHGMYPTFFREFAFTFGSLNTAGIYNTAVNPGGITSHLGGTGLLYAAFQVDRSLMNSAYSLHFDLYSEKFRSGDIDANYYAPFTNDAGTTVRGVPEPSTALLMGAGLLGVGLWQRRRASQSV